MKLIWECIATVHLFPQLFPWQKRPLTRGKNQQTRVHKNQTLAHRSFLSVVFHPSLTFSCIFLDGGFFFYLWNHPLLSQRWTLALTWFSREPPSDKLHSLCESRMRNSGIVDIKAGVFVGHAGAKGMKGANQSGLTDSVWTVGSLAPQVAHFQVCNGGDQNRFELREERLRWSETRYCEWEREKKALHRENGE